MESRWRYNIYQYGIDAWEFDLCARLLDFPSLLVCGRFIGPYSFCAYYGRLSDTNAEVFFTFSSLLHFPYGNRVEPDS